MNQAIKMPVGNQKGELNLKIRGMIGSYKSSNLAGVQGQCFAGRKPKFSIYINNNKKAK